MAYIYMKDNILIYMYIFYVSIIQYNIYFAHLLDTYIIGLPKRIWAIHLVINYRLG